jgi:hypothetical protein
MLRDSDNLLGPRHIIPTVHEHIRVIQQLRVGRSGADRRALLSLQVEFAEFAGWLHQDCGDFGQARYWLDRALEWSHASADSQMTVYVEETGSGRIVNELALLDGNLARWAGLPAVAAFRNALTAVIPQETDTRVD